MWYNDRTLLVSFYNVLVESDVIEDTKESQTYFRAPQRYDALYAEWARLDYPTSEDEEWDDWLTFLSEDDDLTDDESEDDESEDESEDDDDNNESA